MSARNVYLDRGVLELAFSSLAIRLEENGTGPFGLVVCGGSALILTGLIPRTTRDVDVVAMMQAGALCSPDPLPTDLLKAADEVAEDLGFPKGWLNNGPSRGEGGLFQMGLPDGFAARLVSTAFSARLKVHFVSRWDQIHFKLYAAVDRGGYHIEDLRMLKPTPPELLAAAHWTMGHDVSEGYAISLKRLLKGIGYDAVADQL